jgi:hypothetical protein
MGRMSRPVGAGTEEPVVVVGIQMVGLHEPHQVHGVQVAGEPAVGLIDVIADRLGAGDALIADLDRSRGLPANSLPRNQTPGEVYVKQRGFLL